MKKIIISIITAILSLISTVSVYAEDAVKDTMYRDKSAEFNYETQTGVITLENYVPGEMKVAQEAKAVDALLILDFSSSMVGTQGAYSLHESFNTRVADTKYYAGQFGLVKSHSCQEQTKNNCFNVTYNGTTYPVSICHRMYETQGSMGEWTVWGSRDWCYITVNSKRIYLRPDGEFVEAVNDTDPTYTSFPKSKDNNFPISPAQDGTEMIYCTYKDDPRTTTTRALALQKGVNYMIDLLKDYETKSGKSNRISICQFQATDNSKIMLDNYGEATSSIPYPHVTSGKNVYLIENYTDMKYNGSTKKWDTEAGSYAGKSSVLKKWTNLSTTNATDMLKRSLTDIQFKGQTPHNAGLAIGKELMKYARSKDSDNNDVAQFVIIFSDGEPVGASSTIFDQPIATAACGYANDIKTTYPNAKIYTIYCNSSSPDATVQGFMERMSSNYKNATSYNNGTKVESKYYKEVKDDLAKVFEDITSEIIVEASSKYDVNTTLNDFVNNEYFQLPEGVDQSTAYDNVLVYENKCIGYNSSTKEYSWGSMTDATKTRQLTQADGITITITKGDKTLPKTNPAYNDKVQVSGYDYGQNWCGMDISKTPNVPHGARLVVKFPFVYTSSQVWGDLPTNSSDSGVTVKDKKTGEVKEDVKYPVPTLPFCYIKLTRANLHKGESAIYLVEKPNSSGGYDFVDYVVINGTGSNLDTCALYGVPGETFRITETDWNWAYEKTVSSIEHTVDKSHEPYEILYEFTGDHREPDPSGTQHQQEKDPVNLHNHDEAYKINNMALPTTP